MMSIYRVHIYNNHYKIANAENYIYNWSVGIESSIYAEYNFFQVNPGTGITPDQFIGVFRGTAGFETGAMLNSQSQSGHHETDVLAAYNAVNDPDLLHDVGWTPALFVDLLDTQDVPPAVESGAGPFNWRPGSPIRCEAHIVKRRQDSGLIRFTYPATILNRPR